MQCHWDQVDSPLERHTWSPGLFPLTIYAHVLWQQQHLTGIPWHSYGPGLLASVGSCQPQMTRIRSYWLWLVCLYPSNFRYPYWYINLIICLLLHCNYTNFLDNHCYNKHGRHFHDYSHCVWPTRWPDYIWPSRWPASCWLCTWPISCGTTSTLLFYQCTPWFGYFASDCTKQNHVTHSYARKPLQVDVTDILYLF